MVAKETPLISGMISLLWFETLVWYPTPLVIGNTPSVGDRGLTPAVPEHCKGKTLSIKLCFTICEIIFGIHIEHDNIINFVNYIIILGKWYINNCRMNAKTIQINEFQQIVENLVYAKTLT